MQSNKISDGLVVYLRDYGVQIYNADSCVGTIVTREDAAELASVLLRYVVTGKIGE